MWLSRLDLLAFGRFSDVRLHLGPGLHLIYGPNEAGKSTTLRAIRQLLFGFDERPTDNFVHANPNLRIGGVVCDGSSRQLEVIRRKTRKDSLRAADDTQIVDEAHLEELLCGLDETTFSSRYGIDYDRLVEGGRQIANGSGDLGEILFATGSGVRDLTSIQLQLDEEAAELFRPKGQKQRLNVALVEWQKQKELVNQKLLPVSGWEEADRLRHETETQLEHASREWTRQTAEGDRFRIWLQAWPLILEQETLERQLASLESTPPLPSDFGKVRQEAAVLVKHAQDLEATASEDLLQAERELQSLAIPKGLLERADELNKLSTEWGSYRKAQIDRPTLVEQTQRHAATISDLLEGLGRSPEDLSIEKIELDRAQRMRIGQLGRQHAGLEHAVQQADQRVESLASQIEKLRTEIAAAPPARSLDELRNWLQQIRSEGDLEAQLQRLRQEIATLQGDAEQQQSRMAPWTGSIASLRSMRIPDSSRFDQYASRFDANQAEQTRLRLRQDELNGGQADLDRQIEVLRQEFNVPTKSELESAREQRDNLWKQIRAASTANSGISDNLLNEYEASLAETDRLADRLRSEADRVAQLEDDLSNREVNVERKKEITDRLAELEAERLAINGQWSAEWSELNAAPLAPREMQTWLARREALLQNDALIVSRSRETEELVQRINGHIASLSNRLAPAAPKFTKSGRRKKSVSATAATESSMTRQQLSFEWLPNSAGTEGLESDRGASDRLQTLNDLAAYAEVQLKNDSVTQQQRRDAEEALSRMTSDQEQAVEQMQRARQELDHWKTAWQAAIAEVGLPPESTPDAAAAHVETLGELIEVQRQLEQLRERIRGIDSDAESFVQKVKTVCGELASELVDRPVDQVVTTLRTRLAASQRHQTIFNDQTARKNHAEKQLALARESRLRGESLVYDLCRSAGLPELVESETEREADALGGILDQLASLEERSQNRSVLDDRLERVREQLHVLAQQTPIAEFIEQVRRQSPEDLSKSIREIDQSAELLREQEKRLSEQLGGLKRDLESIDGSADAAEAEERQKQWLAQIRSDAEQYVRFKLAGAVLRTAVERYREKTRAPVLNVASELFRELTLGSFQGLRVDDENHTMPVLVGVRPGAADAVAVTCMSEGTCDQLYLALRLASLRLESAPRNRLPFVVDDILIQFDDARAAAALRVLANLAQQRQVIFFTHHEHLLKIASEKLGTQVAVHRLQA